MNLQLSIKNTAENTSDFKPQTIDIYIAEAKNAEELFDVQADRTETRPTERLNCADSIIKQTDYLTFTPEVLSGLVKAGTFPQELDLEKVDVILKTFGHEIN